MLVMIVVAVIVIAVLAVVVLFYTGTGTMLLSTSATVVAAQDQATITASVQAPFLVSAGAVDWNFGDGGTVSAGGTSQTHVYQFPGSFFILASSPMSNGKSVSNAQSLFEMQIVQPNVANPNPLGSTSAYAIIAINTTASSPGAPNLPSKGSLVYAAAIQAEPTFGTAPSTPGYQDLVNPANNTWSNYTWAVTSMTIDFGDGSNKVTNTTSDPFGTSLDVYRGTHTYSADGIYTMTVSLTTQNYSATQYNGNPATPPEVPVSGAANSITTKVGQTVTVGPYSRPPVTIQNPGVITNMEAVTGGYTTLDPSLDYESTGFEVIANTYETLLEYNGTQTASFVPVIADSIPTVQNGNVSADFMTYTFHIRPNLHFAYNNGKDNVTAWDVKYSITRTMLFDAGSPFPPGWIVSQYLVPGIFVPETINASFYQTLYNAIEVNNVTQTVTFHLQLPAPPILWYQIVSDALGTGVIDHKWLEATGPALEWSATGFTNYELYSGPTTRINAWQNGVAGSGPFVVQYENNPNDVVLVPNPYFTPLPGVPAADPSVQKVVLEWIGSDSTRELGLGSGAADIAGISPAHFNVVKDYISKGLIRTQFISTLNMFWWNFNFDIYSPGGSNLYGNTVPSNFFVDINMRKAFFYAYDFNQYFNTFLGNGIYGVNFGFPYNGIVPYGMIGYQNLSYIDKFDLALAKQYFQNSTWYKTHTSNPGFTLTLNPPTADPVDEEAAAAWATNLETLASGITVNVEAISFSDAVGQSIPWQNPMSVFWLGWLPDYPWPTDYTVPMMLPSTGAVNDTAGANGGTYPNGNNLNIPLFQADPTGQNQVAQLQQMHDLILDSAVSLNSTNTAIVVNESQQAQDIGANLFLYVPGLQQNTFFSYRTWINGMSRETNPVLGGADLLYNLLSKGTGASAASLSVQTTGTGSAAAIFLAMGGPLNLVGLVGAVVSGRRLRPWLDRRR